MSERTTEEAVSATDTKTAHAVRCERVQQIRTLAADAFKDHQIETLHEYGIYRHYRCNRPGSWVYGFNVTTFPGRLVVTGDIGDMMWERCRDMFEWAPSAINSIDYFEEKVPHGIQTKEFDAEVARAVLEEFDCDDTPGKETYERVQECLRCLDDGQPFFEMAVCESQLYDGCDWPDFTVFNGRFLWCREALLWLFRQRGMLQVTEQSAERSGG